MGLGDQLMATGMAKGAAGRGKRIAFGNRRRIIWDSNSETVFKRNPNIARSGEENTNASQIEWIEFYKGNRHYNTHDRAANRWIWNMDFRPEPGEMYFTGDEEAWGRRHGNLAVILEPNLPVFKSSSPNKEWPLERFDAVADKLRQIGCDVAQFYYGPATKRVRGARAIRSDNVRYSFAALKAARLYIGPEGGLHHAAAAFGVPAVVFFGGFIPPQVTGYPDHANLTGGETEACGSLNRCEHCRQAMLRIEVDEVVSAARQVVAKREAKQDTT